MKILFFLLLFLLNIFNAGASMFNKLAVNEFAESSKCIMHFAKYEKQYDIPKDLLYSISLRETGKKHTEANKTIVWPWTLNIDGKGYYFNNKFEAIKFAKKAISEGVKNIDVGCMQINMKYHKNNFRSLAHAIEPKFNIAFGAKFLRDQYDRLGSWKQAVAAYHSSDAEKGSKYLSGVLKIASNIEKHKFHRRPINGFFDSRGRLARFPPLYKSQYSALYKKKKS
ncbi:MAG: transglycosylase SLT domain-containing protein [Rickettsiaceae bacterium]|nr:transglycosylase SLT domain-containing protein [Rickettsiaceae bacterium]